MNNKFIFLVVFFVLQPLFCNAQKKEMCIAHYNSKKLLENWSAWQKKELKVKEYRDSLNNESKLEQEIFMKKIQDFQHSLERSCPTQAELESRYKEFEAEERQLLTKEGAIDSQISVRKQELEKPLNERLNNVLQSVAEKRNYTYILDASTIKMHINGGEDVTPFLREKLEEK